MSKLIVDETKFPNTVRSNLQYYIGSYVWCKAHTDAEGNFIVMGNFRQCKDYMMDLHFRRQDHLLKEHWTQENIDEVCYILNMPAKYEATLEKNVKEYLNVIEKNNRFKRTTITKFKDVTLTNDVNPYTYYAVKASNMWGKNCIMRSTFLTLLRMCHNYTGTGLIKTIDDYVTHVGVNDTKYFNSFTESAKKFYLHCLNNPRLLLQNPTNVSPTGFKGGESLSHGQTGLMYALLYAARYPHLVNNNIPILFKEWQDANPE